MKFYEKLLEILEAHGVQRVYGVPGDALNPMLEALRTQDAIRYVHVTHEEAGAFAASAAAKLSGRLQVCSGTVGPGAIHLLNGLYDAKKDRCPVLAIVGQVPTAVANGDYHQEVRLTQLFSDVADYIAEIRSPEQLPEVAVEACNTAVARGAVAVLVIPHDLGGKDVADEPVAVVTRDRLGRLRADGQSLQSAADTLDQAETTCLFVGEGARESRDEVLRLAEHLRSPIVYSLRAKDFLPHDHPLVMGGLGLLGSRPGVKAMESCDLLVVIGSDFPYREWYNPDCKLLQIDTRAEVIGRRRPGAIAIHADVGVTLNWLLDNTREHSDGSYVADIGKARESWRDLLRNREVAGDLDQPAHPQALTRMLSDMSSDTAVFTCDTGEVTVWAARHLCLRPSQRLTMSFNLASMAYALPAALGAQLQYPERQVVALCGDGGFNMLMGDLLTAVKYQLPIKAVIYNNGKLGLIQMEQESEGYPEHETDLQNPDYAGLATAMGARGFRFASREALASGLEAALATPGPVVIDVPINPDEVTFPPKLQVSQLLGFGLAKFRELKDDFLW